MYLKPTFFNAFHKRGYRSPPVPCLDPRCGGTADEFDLAELRALTVYQLNQDPTAAVKMTCGKCHRTWPYDQRTVLALTPDDLKPCPLPQDCAWAILLMEIPTAEEMPQRAFAGERVLVAELKEDIENWNGTLVSKSQFAPDLTDGTTLGGPKLNGYLVALSGIIGGKWTPLPVKGAPNGSDFGMFFLPKTGDKTLLECANPFCSNPSCGHIFGLTQTQFEQQMAQVRDRERSLGQGTKGYMTLKCEICQTACIADSETFRKLFRV